MCTPLLNVTKQQTPQDPTQTKPTYPPMPNVTKQQTPQDPTQHITTRKT